MAVNLLLADDSPTIAKILDLALQIEDYAIRSVATADAAHQEILKNPPDLFLVDIALPQKNGREFVKFIRHAPKLSRIRVILLANAFDPVDEAALLKEGADGVIVKPFDPVALRSKLKAVMDAPPAAPGAVAPTQVSQALPQSPPITPAATAPAPATPSASTAGLSPYAKALADFFSAEVDANKTPPPAPTPEVTLPPPNVVGVTATPPPAELSEAELDLDVPPALPEDVIVPLEREGKIESGGLGGLQTQDWTASDIQPVDGTQKTYLGLPVQKPAENTKTFLGLPVQKPAEVPEVSRVNLEAPAGASLDPDFHGSALFDTGNSNFTFSNDYVNRVLHAFTGNTDEPVPQRWDKHPQLEEPQDVAVQAAATPLFPQSASDTAPRSSGWTGMDVSRMEQMIREEVRVAVREIVERVVRDTIPSLAEQLIQAEIARLTNETEQ